jgi:SAM-dependent methyltransferase
MTGEAERYLPQMTGAHISYEHWHRYLFAARLVAGKAVLDVACGEGYGSRLLAETAASVVGVDVDPAAVRDAAASYPAWNLTFLCGPAELIPVEGEHVFDVIVSFETLEHLTADGQARFAAEIKRLLKPDGLLLISTPNRPVYTDRSGHHNPYHLHEFDRQEFVDYLRGHFAHVEVLCQRVYPGSYIWNADRPVNTYAEHQLALRDGRFEPVRGDGKEQLYFIAACSDHEPAGLDNSLLVDLDDVAIRGLPGAHGFHDAILYADTGGGFGDPSACSRRVPDRGDFAVTYSLREFGAIQGLRWDPVERRFCRLRLDRIGWRDEWGAEHEIDPAAVATNGTREDDGTFRFETADPLVLLPVTGAAASLTIRGRLEAEEPEETLPRLEAACRALRAELDSLPRPVTTLYADDGDGFRAALSVGRLAPDGDFEITFAVPDLSPPPLRGRVRVGGDTSTDSGSSDPPPAADAATSPLAGEVRPPESVGVKALRWDPIEQRFVRLRLDRVTWEDASGTGHETDLSDVVTNGTREADGTIRFETVDPQVVLPIAGEVRRVTVRGRLEVEDPAVTLARLEVERGELYAELDRTRAYLQTVIRDARAEVERRQAEVERRQAEIDRQAGVIAQKDGAIAGRDGVIAEQRGVIAEQRGVIAGRDGVIARQADALARQNEEITRQQGLVTTLYGDDGGGFRAELSRAVPLPGGGSGPFDVTFPIADFPAVKAFRWDPVECRLARVQLDEVLWEDADGRAHRLDLSSVACNGTSPIPGWYEFDTLDPAMLLPITGGVRSVTVRGRWATDPPTTSLVKVHARLAEARRRLAAREEQLRDVSAGLGVVPGGPPAGDIEEPAVARQVGAVRALVAAHEARGRELDETRADLGAASRRADALEAELRAVLGSRKWRFIWSATNAAYYLPRLLRARLRSLRQRLRA